MKFSLSIFSDSITILSFSIHEDVIAEIIILLILPSLIASLFLQLSIECWGEEDGDVEFAKMNYEDFIRKVIKEEMEAIFEQ